MRDASSIRVCHQKPNPARETVPLRCRSTEMLFYHYGASLTIHIFNQVQTNIVLLNETFRHEAPQVILFYLIAQGLEKEPLKVVLGPKECIRKFPNQIFLGLSMRVNYQIENGILQVDEGEVLATAVPKVLYIFSSSLFQMKFLIQSRR